MAAQITHEHATDEFGNAYMRQVVSPAELRRVLRRNGDSLTRPRDFGAMDEWETEDSE
jgi:hypothetical protein